MANPRTGRRAWTVMAMLAGLHAALLCAGFLAPYDPTEQVRTLPYAPPSTIRFVDTQGNWHLRPFIYASVVRPGSVDDYIEDPTRRAPVRFLRRGAEYSIVGPFRSNLHLFGVDPPARIFVLGSDGYGRDVWSRLVHGGRLSVAAGLLATLGALAVGLTLGALAGFYGRWVDEVVMRLADLFLSVPWLYLLFAVRAALPLHISPQDTFLLLVIVVGVIGWARPARLVRGIVLSARERGFVLAGRGFGASRFYLLRRHVLPQTYGVLLAQAGILIPQFILAEVTLSFLGLGIGEPAPSWGNMLAALQRYYVITSHWWMFAPAVALIPMTAAYYALTSLVHDRVRSVATL